MISKSAMKVIAFHTLHDANVSIVIDGEVHVVLELERLFKTRYFCSASKPIHFEQQWKRAIRTALLQAKLKHDIIFDVAVTSWVMPQQIKILKSLINAHTWIHKDHHWCHASLALYDSPFTHPLVVSYDGGGNDGSFLIFKTVDNELNLIEKVKLNLGTPYRQIATAMPEVTRSKQKQDDLMSSYMRFAPLALSGKVMGYAALGKVRKDWIPSLIEYYTDFINPLQALFTLGERLGIGMEPNSLEDETARDLAATSQKVFEDLLIERVGDALCGVDADGICLTGGCALNVNANQRIVKMFGKPVHVPPSPGDCGIGLGACFLVDNPRKYNGGVYQQNLAYVGLALIDHSRLEKLERPCRRVTVDEVARLLVEEHAVIGVARGRQEFGPRALGNRSIICYPNQKFLKDQLNILKGREWFRPLCPSITEESCDVFFGEKINSPYMSFAPPLLDEPREKFPAIAHLDGTARVQTVARESNEWYHSLLKAIGKFEQYEICLNTSFNVKGEPILNSIETALEILDQVADYDLDRYPCFNDPEFPNRSQKKHLLDYVLIDDYLFSPAASSSAKQ